MTLEDIGNWATAAGACLSAIALCLAYYELRKTTTWNRLSATFTLFNHATYEATEQAAAEALNKVGINLRNQREPLPDAAVTEIVANPMLYTQIRAFLNFLEEYALAVRTDTLMRRPPTH